MDDLIHIIGAAAAIGIIAAALIWVFNPGKGMLLLKKLGLGLLGLVFGFMALAQLLPMLRENTGLSSLLFLVVLSLVAYIVREFRLRKKRPYELQGRGIERTPIMPRRSEKEDQQ
jgi:hypothetical protein